MGDETNEIPTPGPRGRQKKPQEPEIGRIVRYVTPQETVRPAIITAVDEGVVDLTIFNSAGAAPATRVRFDEEGDIPHTWHWPSR